MCIGPLFFLFCCQLSSHEYITKISPLHWGRIVTCVFGLVDSALRQAHDKVIFIAQEEKNHYGSEHLAET